MYIVDSDASLQWKKVFLLRSEENIKNSESKLEIQTASGIVRSTREAKVYFQKVGTYLHLNLVGDSVAGTVCGTIGR